LDNGQHGDPNNNTLPLYQQIKEDIKNKISRNEYTQGMRISGEKELIEEYGVSRITVRRAIADLCTEGYLVKRQGLGTYVQKPKIKRLNSGVEGFSQSCAEQGFEPSYRLLQLSIVEARPDERAFLNLPDNNKLIFTSRVLSADGLPIIKENCFYPLNDRFRFLLEVSLEQPLYPLLKQHEIVPAVDNHRTLEISTASKDMSEQLQIPAGSPMFYRVAHITEQNGTPLYIERSYIVGSRYIFYLR
jgi:GntR family transcriptional regulator